MRHFLVVVFLLLGFNLTYSQYINTQVIGVDKGLPTNTVDKAFVDSKGSLWIGSRAGLFKKNNTEFELVPQAAHYKFNNIDQILEDDKGNMWVAGYGQGLLFFNDKQHRLLTKESSGLVNNSVRSLYDFKGKIYAGTLNGVSIISKSDFSVVNPRFTQDSSHYFSVTAFFSYLDQVYLLTLNDGIYRVTEDQLQKVSDLKKTFSSTIWKGKLLIATQDNLLQLDPITFEVLKVYPIGNVWEFHPYLDELYLVSSGIYDTKGGLFALKEDQIIDRTAELKLPFRDLKSLAYDPRNRMLYLGTKNSGLLAADLDSPVFHRETFSEVYALSTNFEKEYVFHHDGLSIYAQDTVFKHVELRAFKALQQAYPKAALKPLTVANHFYPIAYTTPESQIVFYNSEWHQNSLWVSSNLGMYELDLEGNLLSYHPIHVFHFTFFEQELITAVPYGGVRIFKDIHSMDYTYYHDWQNPSIPAEIVSMAKTSKAVYFGSALSGLYQYKGGEFTSFKQAGVFNELKIKRITTSRAERVIVVTDFNDIHVLDPLSVKEPLVRKIPHTRILGTTTYFVKENKGVLYLGTNLGINVIYKDRFFLLDSDQGLLYNNSTAAYSSSDQVLVASKQGYFKIENQYFKKEISKQKQVAITGVLINNQPVSKDFLRRLEKGLELEYNQNNITLYFAIENAKYPNKLEFTYRLKPNEPWRDLTHENQLNLNYLEAGLYQIQLQVSNYNTGVVQVQKLIDIKIHPPYYQNVVFLISVAILLVLGTAILIKYRIKVVKANQLREVKLAALQNEKEKKELLFNTKLADVKLQVLKSQMNSHFLFNVLSSIQYFIISQDTDNALYYLEKFSKLIRKTLEYSDQKSVSLAQELEYLKEYIEIENIRTKYPIEFIVELDPKLDPQQCRITPLLLQPFIENSIVHAFPNSITSPKILLKIRSLDQVIELVLQDNGVGYQSSTNTTHQSKGLSIVRTRLELIQKKLKNPVQISTSKEGTTVVMVLKKLGPLV